MKNDFEKILNKASGVKLSQKEKEIMRSNVVLRTQNRDFEKTPRTSQYSWFLFLSRHTTATFIVIILFMGGGTTAIAEKSLPGDFLYGVKTGINEGVKGWFMKPIKGEAEWQLELADKRLDEVDTLKRENRLTEESRDSLKKSFSAHASRAEKLASTASKIEESEIVSLKLKTEEDLSVSSIETLSMRADIAGEVVLEEISKTFSVPEENEDKEDFSERRARAIQRIEDLKSVTRKDNITKSDILNARFKILKAREAVLDSSFHGEQDIIRFIETAENLLDEAEKILFKE